MTIYAEGPTIRADYFDPKHVVHYSSAVVNSGRSVIFSSTAPPGAPSFRLSYILTAPDTLAVSFAIALPGGRLHEIATGTLRKDQ